MNDAHWFTHPALDLQRFQADYWRKLPAHVVHSEPMIEMLASINGAALLALARDEFTESRLVNCERFSLQHGPFDLDALPANQMLMVQNLESHLPDVANLLTNYFQFLPQWRIEDVMASYGNASANCGAHYDHYDVFLLQLRGEKHWQLDMGNHGPEDLRDDTDVRVLKTFSPTQSLHQTPGDILYVPPGIGHHGIASDDSLTLSIGLRNPTLTEMTSHLADLMIDQDHDSQMLDDEFMGNTVQATQIQGLAKRVVAALSEQTLVSEWYGTYMTQLRDPELLVLPEEMLETSEIQALLTDEETLSCQLPARLATIQQGDVLKVFANGEMLDSSPSEAGWVEALQQQRTVPTSRIPPTEADMDILGQLVDLGVIDISTTN